LKPSHGKDMGLLDSSATTTMVAEIGTKKKVHVTHLLPSIIYSVINHTILWYSILCYIILVFIILDLLYYNTILDTKMQINTILP
jgi:hypothetical protein